MRSTIQAVVDLYTALSACGLPPERPVGGFLAQHPHALGLVGRKGAAQLLWGWGLLGGPAEATLELVVGLARQLVVLTDHGALDDDDDGNDTNMIWMCVEHNEDHL